MKSSHCFRRTGLDFISICIIVCFLLSQQVGVCKSSVISAFSDIRRQYPYEGYLYNVTDEEEVQSNREDWENYVRDRKGKNCVCLLDLFQSKYCSADFVIIAKQYGKPWRFSHDPQWKDFNYAGLVVPVEVQRVLRGPMEPNRVEVIHFVRGIFCGIPRDRIPNGNQSFLVAGFRRTFFRSDEYKHFGYKETKSVYLVTKCGVSEPLQSLSLTQMTGVFMGLYWGKSSCESKEIYKGSSVKPGSGDERRCYFPIDGRECYKVDVLKAFPPELHEKVIESSTSSAEMNDEEKFKACLMEAGSHEHLCEY
ncbi:hypothetical protein Aperf_G00000100020 [Anoplocephala perfoliata]